MENKPHRVRKLLFRLFLLTVVGLGLLVAAMVIWWNWYLPGFVGKQLLPELRKRAGLDEMELKIRRIGLTGLDLEALTLTGEDGGKLSFDSVRADYMPHLPFRTAHSLVITNLTLSGGEIHASVKDGKLAVSGFNLDRVLKRLSERGAAAGAASPVSVTLERVTIRNLRLDLEYEGRRLIIPVAAVVTSERNEWKKIRAELVLTPRGQRIAATVEYDSTAAAAKLKGNAALRLESFSDLTLDRFGGDAKLQFELALGFAGGDVNAVGTLDAELELGDRAGLPVVFTTPVKLRQNCNLRYRTAAKEFHAIFDGEIEPAAVTFDRGTVKAESGGKTRWKFNLSDTGDGIRVSGVELTAGPLRFEGHGFTLRAPQLRLEHLGGHDTISGGGMTLSNPALGVEASGIALLIPLPPDETLPATLNIGSIRRNGKELGAVRGSFRLDGEEMLLSGDFLNKFLPGARVDFRGRVTPRPGQMPDMLLELNVPPWKPKSPLKLSEFAPGFGRATATGTISLGCAVRFENGKLTIGVQLLLEEGVLDWPEQKLKAEDIRIDLRLNDLPEWSTPGSQTFRVGKLRRGEFEFSNLAVRFNLASKEQADIERAGIEWCGGTIMLHSVRFNPSNFDRLSIDTELYCENLSLSGLVSQLGLCQATGDGVLFGKIPVKWSARRGLSIDASYLYSRPGGSSTIRLTDPEKLAGGMADAALRGSQLDFALEALRDFTYEWARIYLTPEGDDLRLSFQFDGKPNQALPFAYDEKNGQLRRDPTARAVFEGIQLNVNTRLPFNRLLQLNEYFRQFTGNTPKEEKP